MRRLVLLLVALVLFTSAAGAVMPKKRANSRLLPTTFGREAFTELASEDSRYHPFQTEILDQFVQTVSQGITSETTMLEGTFSMPESWDGINPENQQAIIEFWLWTLVSTDAAAGTTTVRLKIGSSVVTSITLAEANSQTNRSAIYVGTLSLGPSDGGTGVGVDANGSIYRVNEAGLHSTAVPASASGAVLGIGLDYTGENTASMTIQSGDAGTNIDSCHGWMKITYRVPPIA